MAIPDSEAGGLMRDMLNAIGDDMLEKTGGDTYRSGQHLQGDPNHPQDAGSPPPSEPVVEPEPQKAPAEEPWFIPGMYKTQEEAIRGIHETKRYAHEAKTQAQANAELVAKLQQAIAPTPTPPDPLQELENFGVPKDLLDKAIKAKSVEAIQEFFGPSLRKIEADQKVTALFPEYQTEAQKLIEFVEGDSELKRKVERAEAAGEYLLARELAWLNYERARGLTKTEELTKAGENRVAQAKEQMAAAVVTKPGQSEARLKPVAESPNDISQEKFEDLVALNKAGYGNQLWRATIGSVLARDYPTVFGPEANGP